MKKLFFSIILLCVAILFLIFEHKSSAITINHHSFIVDIAKTEQEKEIGLAKYISLPEDHGMYFPFDHADYYTFWMKNMQFPIDIIFLDHNRIVAIFPSVASPKKGQKDLPTYQTPSLSDAVLEINAGLSKKYNFRIGDSVQLH